MAQDPNAPGGGEPNASGNGTGDEKSPTVTREAFERLLGEKKNLGKRLQEVESSFAEIKAQIDAANEAKLLAEKNHETVIGNQRKEIETLKGEVGKFRAERTDSKKMGSFLEQVGALERKFWGLVDLDEIKTDQDGAVDIESVKAYAETFKKTYPEVSGGKGSGQGLPNGKPQGGGQSLTVDQWKQLPLKERKARMAEAYEANSKRKA